MKITLVQPDIIWENCEINLKKTGELIEQHSPVTDLLVLPEMFNTGFSINATSLAEKSDGPTYNCMAGIASKYDCAVCGSFLAEEAGSFYNRFAFVHNNLLLNYYDKRHLFTIGGEADLLTRGEKRSLIAYKDFTILPVVCYDLRFPVWLRNRHDYDLMVVVANWPESRRSVWDILLKARAIENQCYVAAVNRVGEDPSGNRYTGDSMVIDPRGRIIACTAENYAGVITTEISINELNDFRSKFPVWRDADDFTLSP